MIGHTYMGVTTLSPDLCKMIQSLSQAMAENAPNGYRLILEEHLKVGMIALFLHKKAEIQNPQKLPLPKWKERIAKELMLSNLAEPMPIADVAKACSLSRSHFSRAFKQSTGASPKEWLMDMKIKISQQLLSDEFISLTDISLKCGFSDQSHFCRTFLKHVGMTPKSWRRAELAGQVTIRAKPDDLFDSPEA